VGKRSRRRGEPEPGAVEEAEPEEGAASGNGGPAPLRPDGRLREVALLVEEADYLLALYRWIVLTGEVPRAQDWLRREDWPHPDYVLDVFGSWERFLTAADVPASPVLAALRTAEEDRRTIAAREERLQRELARADDLRRQTDTARRRREAADAQRAELAGRAERLAVQLGQAEARAATAEAHLADRRQATAAAAQAGPAPEASEPWLAAHAALEDELEAVRAHREELLSEVEALREAAARDARTITGLSQALSEAGGARDDGADTAVPQDAPATVEEAVRRAAAGAQHLRFTDAAFASAADSPYRRPADVLDALERLDELAGLFADPDGFGASLSQAATALGLSWRQNVSETARSRKPHLYAVTHDGERLELGPHVGLGSGSGAGFIARVYLHVADGSGPVPRGLYVGHVGRHLPDTTTA
jgi:hypothetical protein